MTLSMRQTAKSAEGRRAYRVLGAPSGVDCSAVTQPLYICNRTSGRAAFGQDANTPRI
jgi:hypothetical protein